MRRVLWIVFVLLVIAGIVALLFYLRRPESAVPGPGEIELVRGAARVETIEIVLLETFPVQVRVVARGNHPDSCTALGEVTSRRAGNAFVVNVQSTRPKDAICAEVLTPFEATVTLDVRDLPAGTYTVDVNGVRDTFTLRTANTLPPPGGNPPEIKG